MVARQNSPTSARFLIAELRLEHTENAFYIKIVDLDFETGDYSVKTSEPFATLQYIVNGSYSTFGAQKLNDEQGKPSNILLFAVGYGLDDKNQ